MKETRRSLATKLIDNTTYFNNCRDLQGLTREEKIERLVKNTNRTMKTMKEILEKYN